ncbi:unnamed protein product [Adineta steineri]|uniref:peptide-methionine (S)-S-oxide reductase n=1 Tax=Adineta steineri TaxID=433720 RepID=A0A814FM34_9BILA|nr:unnamed protein product [Adineta steineri]CAF0983155.1 unnamed protein product [Adineta steineri]
MAAAGKAGAELATFGAGCFWGTEKFFRKQFGTNLISAMVGYMGGASKSNYEDVCTGTTNHAEVLQVSYDPNKVVYDAPENNTNGSTPTMPSTTTSTVYSASNEPDIPLILGLTLGLGIPLILVTIAFIAYYVRVHTRGKQYHKDSAEFDIPRIYSIDRYDGDNQILTTIF